MTTTRERQEQLARWLRLLVETLRLQDGPTWEALVKIVSGKTAALSAWDLQGFVWTGNVPLSPYEKSQIAAMQDGIGRHFQWRSRFWTTPWRQLRRELGLTPWNFIPIFMY